MVAVQLVTLAIVIAFLAYIAWLLALDLLFLVVNTAILYALLWKALKMLRAGLYRLLLACSLIVLVVMLVFRFPGIPLYLITWFVLLSLALAVLASWAHDMKYVDLSSLIERRATKRK